jgi:hypothetical protein
MTKTSTSRSLHEETPIQESLEARFHSASATGSGFGLTTSISLSPVSGVPGKSQEASTDDSFEDGLTWFKEKFRPHFDQWVMQPIDDLVSGDHPLIGFLLMACAIDYLASFWWGKSTKNEVKNAYTGFVNEYFPAESYDADGLYDSLRNGLVHMFTIKDRKYALVADRPDLHLIVDANGQAILNAQDFHKDLVRAKQRFFDSVESNSHLLDRVMQRHTRDGFLELVDVALPPSIQ